MRVPDGNPHLSVGESKTSPVAAEDVARVIATLPANPQPHIGKFATDPNEGPISAHAGIVRGLLDFGEAHE